MTYYYIYQLLTLIHFQQQISKEILKYSAIFCGQKIPEFYNIDVDLKIQYI